MRDRIRVKPAEMAGKESLKVPMIDGGFVPSLEKGIKVEDNAFYRRLIREGALIVVKDEEVKAKAKKEDK